MLKERVAGGRRLADAIRAAVPASKDGSRTPRGKASASAAAGPLDADVLRCSMLHHYLPAPLSAAQSCYLRVITVLHVKPEFSSGLCR